MKCPKCNGELMRVPRNPESDEYVAFSTYWVCTEYDCDFWDWDKNLQPSRSKEEDIHEK